MKLSPQEVEFFAAYDRLLSGYAREYPLLDLTGLPQVSTTTTKQCGSPDAELKI